YKPRRRPRTPAPPPRPEPAPAAKRKRPDTAPPAPATTASDPASATPRRRSSRRFRPAPRGDRRGRVSLVLLRRLSSFRRQLGQHTAAALRQGVDGAAHGGDLLLGEGRPAQHDAQVLAHRA